MFRVLLDITDTRFSSGTVISGSLFCGINMQTEETFFSHFSSRRTSVIPAREAAQDE